MIQIFYIFLAAALAASGDIFLKKATLAKGTTEYIYLAIGILIYAANAVMFYWIYKSSEFSSVGPYYAMATILLFVVIGVTVFGDTVTKGELVGIALAAGSILLLSRFAG